VLHKSLIIGLLGDSDAIEIGYVRSCDDLEVDTAHVDLEKFIFVDGEHCS
jgi:hypothetical protein